MPDLYLRFLWGALMLIGLLILCCVFRAVRGPQAVDRLVAVNMTTTLVTIAICILTFLLSEDYLADAALIFALLGCLSVVVLSRVLLSRIGGKPAERKEEKPRVE